jgi:hypothetical protein
MSQEETPKLSSQRRASVTAVAEELASENDAAKLGMAVPCSVWVRDMKTHNE